MKKLKLKLDDLQVKSFKTQSDSQFTKTVKGGATVNNCNRNDIPTEVCIATAGIICTITNGDAD